MNGCLMGMVKKSITVTDQQDNWIKAQITAGNFGNESEVLRELIRERQQQEQERFAASEIEKIRARLVHAEDSGFTDQSPMELLNEIKLGLGRNGSL